MRRKRIVWFVALALVLVAVAGALAVDAVARGALERTLRETFGTEAHVASVDVGLLSGEVRAEGFVVSNPSTAQGSGFESPHFASLARARVTAGLRELLGDTAVVRQVVLEGFEVHLERAGGETNFGPILEHVRAAGGAVEGEEPTLFRIEELILRDVAARVRLGPAPGEAEGRGVEIDEIRLENLGSESGGALTLSEVASTVLGAALRAVLERSDSLGALAGALRSELGGLGRVPGGLEIRMPEGQGEGVARKVEDAIRGVLPGGG